ncbi:MAG TPA: response regulator [Acidobacteriaceae bacterium]|jgi:CheY-like chemotaxis protein
MLNFLLRRIPDETSQPNILLIDDDRDIRTVTNLVLMTSGIGTIHEAASGQEGLEMARQIRPDVILLDIKLPDIGGETVLQLLKMDPWTREIPVVLFSAQTKNHENLQAWPVADVVSKPFYPQHLCESVCRALGKPYSIEAEGERGGSWSMRSGRPVPTAIPAAT